MSKKSLEWGLFMGLEEQQFLGVNCTCLGLGEG